MGRSFRVCGVLGLALLSGLVLFSSCARKQAVSEKPSVLGAATPPAVARPAPAPGPGPAEAAVPPGVARPMRPEGMPGERPGEVARPGVREEAVRPGVREEVIRPGLREEAVRPGMPPAVAAVPGVPPAVRAVTPLKDIFFDFDKYNIRPDARKTLEENARWLQGNPKAKIQIEGHADERGTDEYNLALGERRANAAKNFLKLVGVELERISIISYGEFRPLEPGHNEEAWAKNRRDHFGVVSP